MRSWALYRLLVPALLVLVSSPARADTVTAAVASNFAGAMHALVAEFEARSEHEVELVFGASGRFHAQIANGAPFDVFFSADQAKPLDLVRRGLALPDSRFTYALGGLVLWSADAGRVDETGQVLRTGAFRRLAIANPRLAPYGVAALEVLARLGLQEAMAGKLVQGENIAQAYQFVDSGNAELGFVARSQVMAGGVLTGGSGWPVPAGLHEPIRQDAVWLQRGAANEAARELLRFVGSESGRAIIESFGYTTEGN